MADAIVTPPQRAGLVQRMINHLKSIRTGDKYNEYGERTKIKRKIKKSKKKKPPKPPEKMSKGGPDINEQNLGSGTLSEAAEAKKKRKSALDKLNEELNKQGM